MGRLKTLDEWLDWQEALHTQEIDLGLERIQKVYQKLFPNGVPFQVITVAGTNGKGSTVAFIDSIYQQSDFKVGAFTSPHLIKYNERFTINGKIVSDKAICQAFEQIESCRSDVSLTYFEFSTLAALVIFANEKIDVAVLEIGLGGRLDSVNVIDPDVSVITNIAIDHTDYLGDTREAIGFEKAGIMRNGVPCICGDTNPPKSLIKHAKSVGSPLILADLPCLGDIGLKGNHQRQNAATAIEAIKQLHEIFPITQQQITKGIKSTNLSGRMQIKTVNNKKFILDVAHNEAATEVLANELEKENIPTLAIFSALQDKDINSMIDKIRPIIDQWYLTPINVDRAISIKELSNKFNLSDKIKVCNNMNSAMHLALTNKHFKRIVIFGSFHTVADASKILNKLQLNN